MIGKLRSRWQTRPGTQTLSQTPPPILVGGTGGSGTRLVVTLLTCAGVYMGRAVNESNDAKFPGRVLNKWHQPYLTTSLTPAQQKQLHHELRQAYSQHRLGMSDPNQLWGSKNPPSYLFLPLLVELFPQLKFIHVIRDGRDIAFSKNQRQLRLFGDYFLPGRLATAPQPLRTIAYWNHANNQTAAFGQTNLGANYLCLRFEDLCHQPEQTMAQLFDFIGEDATHLSQAISHIQAPSSIGRWRTQAGDLLPELEKEGQEALQNFGYLPLI